MVLVAPLFVLLKMDAPPEILAKMATVHGVLVVGLIYVINWFLYPFIMLSVTTLMDVRDKYYRYIGAFNWASLLMAILFFILSKAGSMGLLPAGLVVVLFFRFLVPVDRLQRGHRAIHVGSSDIPRHGVRHD